ncbi:MAG: hypothetical protein IGS03_12745 [Candidatus Sericytochromatia bacterium]|nr:hypothetical protein [Candidatus Sericytochromatia bacterium]
MALFSLLNLPFLLLIALAFGFLGLHLLGTGPESAELDLPDDLDLPAADPLLGIFTTPRIPLSLLLMSGSFYWGSVGLLGNLWLQQRGAYPGWGLPAVLALSLLPAMLLTRLTAQGLGRLFQESSAAGGPEDLLGCVGTVISSAIPSTEGFGRIRAYSPQGVLLQLACVTHPDCTPPRQHEAVFITGYDPDTRLYTVLGYESPDYLAWQHGHAGEMQRFEARLQQSLACQNQFESKELTP